MTNDAQIILGGIVAAVNGSLLGSYLLLQRNALVSDAISHSVLPGIVIAFLISGSKASFPLLIGAALTGVALTQLLQWLQHTAKLQKDAALGLAYTFMFASGLILLSVYLRDIDLDAECVLFGEIAYVPIDQMAIGTKYYPRAIVYLLPSLLVCLGVLILAKKPLFLTTFNPEFSKSIGIKITFWQQVILILTSLFTVMSFELVGAILVVGFMVIPPATGLLFAQTLRQMLVLSALFGIIAVISGYYLALHFNVSITGCIVCCAGIILLLSIIVSRNWKFKGIHERAKAIE